MIQIWENVVTLDNVNFPIRKARNVGMISKVH